MTLSASFLLVRHAAHGDLGERLTGRGPEGGLSAAGRQQTEALAARLSGEPIDALYASPRLRTQETAAAIAAASGTPVQLAAELDEIDFGQWTGCRFDELDGRPEWDAWNRVRSRARCPGGESMTEAVDRALSLLRALDERHAGGRVVAVTHCDIIRALLCWRDGRSLDRILSYEAEPASVTPFDLGRRARAAA